MTAYEELSKNDTIIITPTDKSGGVVIMNK